MALFDTPPAPKKPASNGITYFGETDSRGQRVRFGIRDEDRTRHMYVIGQTGMGKSVLLENMAVQDIQNGNGLCFIDPHGSAIDTLMDYIPEHRVKDVVYFAPFDLEYPISFNVMEDVGPDKRHLVASGLLSAFKKIWGEETFSARMEHIVNNTLLALLEYPNTTILSMTRMLTERAYRDKVVENIKEPSVKAFWINEYGAWDERYQKEAAAGVLNKVSQFVSNPIIRNIVGQPKSSFDFRDAMDNKKIILINLSKGQVGEANSKLLGAMLTTKVYLAAMSRADVSQAVMKTLPYFYLYVDEFQTVVNDSFESILSEARKYRLSLIIAHQYIEQMPELVRAAVFGNVGTRINFRVGAVDAEWLEKGFGEKFTAPDIVGLSRFQVYLILMIDGVGSEPFSARTLPPIEPPARSYRQEVIETSRRLYAGNRDKIEADIVAWMFDSSDATQKNREKNRRKKERKKENEYEKRTGKKAPWAKPRGPAHGGGNTQTDKKPELDPEAIGDLPGATNFKDAFAVALADGKEKIKAETEEKPIVPASIKPDTKTYSVGDALKKKKTARVENKEIHKAGNVEIALKPDTHPVVQDKSKFAFSFDESKIAQTDMSNSSHLNKQESSDEKKQTQPRRQRHPEVQKHTNKDKEHNQPANSQKNERINQQGQQEQRQRNTNQNQLGKKNSEKNHQEQRRGPQKHNTNKGSNRNNSQKKQQNKPNKAQQESAREGQSKKADGDLTDFISSVTS